MFINEQYGVIWALNGEFWDEISYLAYLVVDGADQPLTQANMTAAIKMLCSI